MSGLVGVTAVALLLATPAAALVYVMPTDEAMVERSPVIVYGEVLTTASALSGDWPATDAFVRVEAVLKGEVLSTVIVVRSPGGIGPDGAWAARVEGMPMLAEGSRVLLFLEEHEAAYRVVQLGLGVFFEVQHRGRRLLMRDKAFAAAVPMSAGALAQEERRYYLPRDSVDFRSWVTDHAAGLEGRAGYFVADLPGRLQSIATPYTLLTAFSCPEGSANALRWTNFDRGESLTFSVHGSQPGVPGGGMSEVLAAMNAWNGVLGANVRLAGSASAGEFQTGRRSVRTAIGFEDPTSLIPGSWEEGSIVAITLLYSTCTRPHAIPGSSARAHELTGAFVVTEDGFHSYLSSYGAPGDNRKNFEEVIAHELGHALGLDHSCDWSRPCNSLTGDALMRLGAYGSARGGRLNADDENGIKHLYPALASGGEDPPSEPEQEPPSPVPPKAAFTVDVPCADGLCRARTGEDVTFTDTSSGDVSRRSWDFSVPANRPPSGEVVRHAWSSPGFYEVTLTVNGAAAESTESRMFLVEAADPAGTCEPDRETICLQDSRYEVRVEWRTPGGESGVGRVVRAGTNDAGLFSFFDGGNWEVLVKVLDGCTANGHHWLYAASATSLQFEMTVTDTATDEVYRYSKGPGEVAALTDPAAFSNSCRADD